MAITLVGTATGGGNNGSDTLIVLPGGIATDDIVVVMGGHGDNGGDAGVSTSGYNEVIDNSRSGRCQFSVSWKRMGGSPDSSVGCKGSGTSTDATAYVAMVFRGVDTSTAIDATSTRAEGDSKNPNSPAITAVTNGAAIISCFIQASDESSITAPTGFLNKTSIHRSDTFPVTAGGAWISTVPGSINPDPWASGTGSDWIAATIALRPAAATIAVDGALSGTGNLAASFVGAVAPATASRVLSATGSVTASFIGTSASNQPVPFSMTGNITASFVGFAQGDGSIDSTLTANVSFVGSRSVITSVREAIESRGAATVRVG